MDDIRLDYAKAGTFESWRPVKDTSEHWSYCSEVTEQFFEIEDGRRTLTLVVSAKRPRGEHYYEAKFGGSNDFNRWWEIEHFHQELGLGRREPGVNELPDKVFLWLELP